MAHIYQHYYKDEPLCIYCKKNGLNYGNVLKYINEHKMTPEDAVDYYIRKKGTRGLNNAKYIIDGKTVRSILGLKRYSFFINKIYYYGHNKNWLDIYQEVLNAEK